MCMSILQMRVYKTYLETVTVFWEVKEFHKLNDAHTIIPVLFCEFESSVGHYEDTET